MADPYAGIAKVVDDDPYAGIAKLDQGRDWSGFASWNDALGEIRKLPPADQQNAMKAWASQTVSKERAKGGIGQTVDDFVRRLARGTPVGSWADEGNALIASKLGIADYDQQLAYERAKDQQGDASATKLGTLPVIGDVTTAGVTKLGGGLASAAVAPAVRVAQGAALLPSMANGLATGAAYGGVYGAGEGETLGERAANAGQGVALGGVIGTAAPVVARGIGNAVKYAGDKARGLPPELQPIGKDAVQRVARAATDDDLVNRYQHQRQELGYEGALMDMGANLRGQASAIANQPGQGQTIIRDTLRNRADFAAPRIEMDIDNAFGPAQNLVQLEANTVAQANQAAAPYFQQFHNMQVPFTQPLQNVLARTPNRVIARAQELADIEGLPFMETRTGQNGQPIQAPTARGWDYIKRSIQDLIEREDAGTEFGRALTQLDNQLRNAVDNVITGGNPANSTWARGRELAGSGKQFQQGLREGAGVFSRPKTHSPDQVADDLTNATPVYEQGYRAGARGDLAAMMDDAATQFGQSGDKSLRKGLWSRNAERKVYQLARDQASARQVLARRNAESTFGETQNAVTANSATAARLQAQKEFPNAAENQGGGPGRADMTIPGLLIEGGRKAINAMTSGARNERLAAMAENAARVLSATGMQRDVYFRGLEKHLRGQGVSQAQAQKITSAIEAMLISSVPTATGAAATSSARP